MHAVRASDQQRVPVLLGPADDGRRRPVDPLEDQRTCLEDLERQGGVEHIRGGEAVVEPPSVLAQLGGDGVDERGDVVLRPLLDLADELG